MLLLNFIEVFLEFFLFGGFCIIGYGLEVISKMFKIKGMKGIFQFLIVFLVEKFYDEVLKFVSELYKVGVLVYVVGLKEMIIVFIVNNLLSDFVLEFFILFLDFVVVDLIKQVLLDKLNRGLLYKYIIYLSRYYSIFQLKQFVVMSF